MNIEQEIRVQIEKNKGLKLAVGEINSHLSILEGLLRNERDDAQKRADEAYQRGLNDAWEAARKVALNSNDGGLGIEDLDEIFDCYTLQQVFKKHTAQQTIAKLKAYEEQKAEDEIKVGDIIANNTEPKLKVWVTYFDEIGFCGTAITNFGTVDKGQLYASCSPKGWHKIGHYDINNILKEMRG